MSSKRVTAESVGESFSAIFRETLSDKYKEYAYIVGNNQDTANKLNRELIGFLYFTFDYSFACYASSNISERLRDSFINNLHIKKDFLPIISNISDKYSTIIQDDSIPNKAMSIGNTFGKEFLPANPIKTGTITATNFMEISKLIEMFIRQYEIF